MKIIVNDLNSVPYRIQNQEFKEMVVLEIDRNLKRTFEFLDNEIMFYNCTFLGGLVFHHLDFSLAHHTKVSTISKLDIVFENCFIACRVSSNKNSIIERENQIITLKFTNTIINNFELSDSNFTNLVFNRVVLYSGSFLVQNSTIKSITINNVLGEYCIIDEGNSHVEINYTDDNLYIQKDILFKYFKLISKRKNLLSILYLETTISIKDISKLFVNFKKNRNKPGIRTNYFNDIYKNLIKKSIYCLDDKDLKNLNISIVIDQSNNLTKSIQVKNAILNRFLISGNSDSYINIEHVNSNFISFEEFNSKELKLYDISGNHSNESKIQLYNSNFSNTHFNKVNFNSFAIVNLYRSYLEEIKFSSSSFPEKIESVKNILNVENKESDYYEMQYEIFRQLKSSSIKNNNQVQALEMHEKMHNSITKFKRIPIQDKIILYLNKISNNHDTSIYYPFRLMIASLFILWFIYCFYLPNTPFIIGWNGIDEFIKCVYDYIIFTLANFKILIIIANPVHSINNLNDLLPNKYLQLSNMNYVVSYCSRIIIAWLSYQFISAFRKFGKKL